MKKRIPVMLASAIIIFFGQCWADQPISSASPSCPCNFSSMPTIQHSRINCLEQYDTHFDASSNEVQPINYIVSIQLIDLDKAAVAGDDAMKKLQSLTMWSVSQRINSRSGLQATCLDGVTDLRTQRKEITDVPVLQACMNDIKRAAAQFSTTCELH